MHPYSFTISLRLWHPAMDPALITRSMGMQPKHTATAGQQRRTPKGTLLEGTYRESYWSCSLIPDGEHSSEGTSLEDYLQHFTDQLQDKATFFAKVRNDGGRIEFFVGLYGSRNFGLELPPSLLQAIASLGATVSLDVYPNP